MEDASAWEWALLVGGFLVISLVPALAWHRRILKRWRTAAAATGLTLTGAKQIKARVPGGALEAGEGSRIVYLSSDLPEQVVTSVVGFLDTEPPEFFVASTDGGPVGGSPFTTGDDDFDKVVVVGAKDAEAGQAYLTPRRRKALLEFFTALPRGGLAGRRVGYARDGRMGTDELTRTLRAVKNVLEGLQG